MLQYSLVLLTTARINMFLFAFFLLRFFSSLKNTFGKYIGEQDGVIIIIFQSEKKNFFSRVHFRRRKNASKFIYLFIFCFSLENEQ